MKIEFNTNDVLIWLTYTEECIEVAKTRIQSNDLDGAATRLRISRAWLNDAATLLTAATSRLGKDDETGS